MKKALTALSLIYCVLPASAQDNQWAPAHRGTPLLNLDYIVDFNPKRGVAHWVAYELLPTETLGEAKRKSGFKRDERVPNSPVHKDYTHSGFDRGHLKPAADSKSSNERMAASFLMTNVAPQTPQLNCGSWKRRVTGRTNSVQFMLSAVPVWNRKASSLMEKLTFRLRFGKPSCAPCPTRPASPSSCPTKGANSRPFRRIDWSLTHWKPPSALTSSHSFQTNWNPRLKATWIPRGQASGIDSATPASSGVGSDKSTFVLSQS